jgi:molybdopterin/thiamine biosynthesis adenylyltransferase
VTEKPKSTSLERHISETLELVSRKKLLTDINYLSPEALSSKGFSNQSFLFGFTGKQRILGESVELIVAVPKNVSLDLPKIYLEPWDVLGFIPHIDNNGNICFLDLEGVLLDGTQPAVLVTDCLELAKGVLEKGKGNVNQADFLDEFDSYWRLTKDITSVQSFIAPTNKIKIVKVSVEGKKILCVADNVTSVRDYLSGGAPKHVTVKNGLYIPLADDALIVPPRPGSMWNADEVRDIVRNNISHESRKALRHFIKKRNSEAFLIIKLPRPKGGESLIGIHYYSVGEYHPLHDLGVAAKVTPLQLKRFDEMYIKPRGGAFSKLKDKKVLVVGCGSIGGYLSQNLAQAGLANLTLVDPDVLTQENFYRHRLGRKYLYKYKSESLKNELSDNLPYITVDAYAKTIQEVFEDGSVDLANYDLVVSALGNPRVELYLNRALHSMETSPPMVIGWLEPYGIGGHVLLTQSTSGQSAKGCFQCLITSFDDDPPLYNRASFAAAGQDFAKNIAGCGSLFTPFGALDAVRTAELAARLSIDALLGTVEGSPILSWKGDPANFVKAGYKLSKRFNLDERALLERRFEYVNLTCPICNKVNR